MLPYASTIAPDDFVYRPKHYNASPMSLGGVDSPAAALSPGSSSVAGEEPALANSPGPRVSQHEPGASDVSLSDMLFERALIVSHRSVDVIFVMELLLWTHFLKAHDRFM